jgi:hypothetical protein
VAPELLRPFDVQLRDMWFTGAYYFHGTRVTRPDSFLRDGILPLVAILDRIWNELYELCSDQVTPEQWLANAAPVGDRQPHATRPPALGMAVPAQDFPPSRPRPVRFTGA